MWKMPKISEINGVWLSAVYILTWPFFEAEKIYIWLNLMFLITNKSMTVYIIVYKNRINYMQMKIDI